MLHLKSTPHAQCLQTSLPPLLLQVDADFLIRSLAPTFSDVGTMRRQRELKLVNYLQDLMNEFEDKGEDIILAFFFLSHFKLGVCSY